jgi:phosphotransferase system enzyme I (PtsI)
VIVWPPTPPGEVACDSRPIAGFVTETGSHLARHDHGAQLEIPAVVAAGNELARELTDGVTLILDGRTGRVIVDPDASTIAEYQKQLADLKVLSRELFRYVDLPAETKDGVAIRLLANVDQLEEARDALRYGGEGIGLYRTEFLFLNRHDLPGEDEQCAAYSRILAAVMPLLGTIRTLDIGGGKVPTGSISRTRPTPRFGLRGVRMSHHRPDVFRCQLRALLRASTSGKLKILLPMVSSLAEVSTRARRWTRRSAS